MKITSAKQGTALTMTVEGRLDTVTSPEFEKALTQAIDGVKTLTLDFAGLSYISSSGLRVLLNAQKKMNVQGKMTILHCSDTVKEIFDVTGFCDILTIQ